MVTDMSNMFRSASGFNQDLSSWDVGKLSNAKGMFSKAGEFDRDLCAWQSVLPSLSDDYVEKMFQNTACTDTSDPKFRNIAK